MQKDNDKLSFFCYNIHKNRDNSSRWYNMEQKIISKTTEQCICLIKETNLDFYLIIPNCKKVSILLGLFPNINEEIIKTLPKEQDKAIVIPVINNQILTSANHLDTTSFKYLDSIFSYLINTSYKILTYNNLEVNSEILLNNSSTYENFNQKYIEKYQGRVMLYDLVKTPTSKSDINKNIFERASNPTPFPAPANQPFQPQSATSNSTDTLEETIEPILHDEPVISSPDMNNTREPGFVSYVLLGVLIAVISLVFLYVIL